MAAMIDVSANDSGAEFKRRSYERVLNALRDCPTPMRSLADVLDVVQCGASIGRKIAYIIDHDDDLPEVKAFFESSYDDGEDHDDDDAETESEDTDSECESEEDDDADDDTESVGYNDEDTVSEEDHDDDDTESVGSNDEDTASEMESELVVPSQLQALRAVNKIEYSMLAEEGALTVTEALAHLQTLRAYVMATIICAGE